MIALIGGLVLWYAAHMLGRLAPAIRRDMDSALGKKPSYGIMAVLILASVYLMVIGYRAMDFIPIYPPVPGIGHLNNLLMLLSVFAFGIGKAGGRLSAKFRHPMLWGMVIWAVAHLIVNGDLASLLLFGGLGVWALIQMRLINQSEGPWEVPMPGNAVQDWKLGLSSVFLFGVIAGIHWLLDHNPFMGTYG